MKLQLQYPEGLYSDIRISENYSIWYSVQNNEIVADSDSTEIGAMIRVYDGSMWYTASTNSIEDIQTELDSLAKLANPREDIYDLPNIKKLEVNQDSLINYTGQACNKLITRSDLKELADYYISQCVDNSISEINLWAVNLDASHTLHSFLSSKGAEIEYDNQTCELYFAYGITVDSTTYYAFKPVVTDKFEGLKGHVQAILDERTRYLDFAHNCQPCPPGDYTCLLAPQVTAMFTHESFGHKSEADFMLNDETLRAEWVMGKKVGSSLVSICDDGSLFNHGYLPYDDEGSKARPTWLIKEGILTGRLHDANSAVALDEELTGNCRAQNLTCFPIVRMTNTYMAGGDSEPAAMLADIKDGIYVHSVNSGTGQATFTMRPNICYRIRDGKLCEPLKVNIINGNVFQTLFDIDAVGNDFELFNTFTCGKNGQEVNVAAGGPSIRVKKLTIN